jgi:hypothetical protein
MSTLSIGAGFTDFAEIALENHELKTGEPIWPTVTWLRIPPSVTDWVDMTQNSSYCWRRLDPKVSSDNTLLCVSWTFDPERWPLVMQSSLRLWPWWTYALERADPLNFPPVGHSNTKIGIHSFYRGGLIFGRLISDWPLRVCSLRIKGWGQNTF